jgi:hypothetical protein
MNKFQARRQELVDYLLARLIKQFQAFGPDSAQVDRLVERPQFQSDVRTARLEMADLYNRALTKWKLKQGDDGKSTRAVKAQQRLAQMLG